MITSNDAAQCCNQAYNRSISITLSGKLDPEDLREVIREYQDSCYKIIRRFDGHIAQYLGDGLLCSSNLVMTHQIG